MNDSDINELLINFQRSRLILKDLGDDTEELHQTKKAKQEVRGTESYKSVICSTEAHECLFRTLMYGWKFKCHSTHDTMSCLEDRCQENTRPKSKRTVIDFAILFSWQPKSGASISRHQACITIVEGQILTTVNTKL